MFDFLESFALTNSFDVNIFIHVQQHIYDTFLSNIQSISFARLFD